MGDFAMVWLASMLALGMVGGTCFSAIKALEAAENRRQVLAAVLGFVSLSLFAILVAAAAMAAQ